MGYLLDILVLIRYALRPHMRIPFWEGYMLAVFEPFKELHGWFLDFRLLTLRRRAYNGQSYRLELMLNSEYTKDFTGIGYVFNASPANPGREVYIETVADSLPIQYLYTAPETEEISLYTDAENSPNYLLGSMDYAQQADFVVYVPNATWGGWSDDKRAQFRAWIDRHRLAGTRYKIQTY